MFEFFTNFFGNIINIVMFVMAIVIGILFGILIFRYLLPQRNEILYCRERDGRGLALNVEREDAFCLETSSSPEMRFYKWGRSYEFVGRLGRKFTRFFGKEGTAYTWILEGFKKVAKKFKEVEQEEPVFNKEGKAILDEKGNPIFKKVKRKVPTEFEEKRVSLPFDTLEAAVKFRWGEERYMAVPDEMKALLRDDKVFLTVNLEPGIVPEGYEPITESVIFDKADESMAALIANSLRQAIKEPPLRLLVTLLAGVGIALVALVILGRL